MSFLSAALMNKEQESQALSQSTGPSESELALQESIRSLQQERDSLSLQYQAQVTATHKQHFSPLVHACITVAVCDAGAGQ